MTVALAGLMAGMVRVVSGPGHLAPSATPLRGGHTERDLVVRTRR
jgi:hypothetical protein